MNYLLLAFADILLALNFTATKSYQKQEGVLLLKGLIFNIILGAMSAVMFFIMLNFKFEINRYSLIMALIQATLCVTYTIIGFKIMSEGKIAIYTIFLMAGGMIVPYIWGLVFLNEQFSDLRTVGLIIIITAIFISNFEGKKINIHQLLLCFCVFILNGFVSVISKEHQISGIGISSTGFCMLSSVSKAVLSTVALLFIKISSKEKHKNHINKKSLIFIAMASIASGISYLLQLIAAKNLPATVLYPIVTGGSTVLTSISGRVFFKEKFTKTIIISIILCLLGTCLFL